MRGSYTETWQQGTACKTIYPVASRLKMCMPSHTNIQFSGIKCMLVHTMHVKTVSQGGLDTGYQGGRLWAG